jgi:cellulose synthase/poly-beta-1,6-N-acetylglucosamine synthase-like glycosyltransferase
MRRPYITICIAAYNEEEIIKQSLENKLSLLYPPDRVRIIVGSDGSTDRTVEIAQSVHDSRILVLDLPRAGKNQALNALASRADSELLVFADADSFFDSHALEHLVAPFGDAAVGGVAGEYHLKNHKHASAAENAYWRFDQVIKRMQSRAGSALGISGAIYAIRRSLFPRIPNGVSDDSYVTMKIVESGYRIVCEPDARAYGNAVETIEAEYRRKVRLSMYGLRGVWHFRHLLNPFRYGFFAIQLLTHKVLRRLMAIPIFVLPIVTLLLWPAGVLYQTALVMQLAFHLLAAAGWLLRKAAIGKCKLFAFPLYFDMVYIAAIHAIVNLICRPPEKMWTPARHAPVNS